MTSPTADELDELRARVRSLEVDNARLATAGRGGRTRSILSAVCIVVASILLPVSIVTAWARVQLVDEESFVATLAPLVDDPAVQNLAIEQTQRAIDTQIDFDALTGSVFDGISELGLGPAAESALRALEQPAAQGMQNLVNDAVASAVRSDAFSDVWAATVRSAHRALTTAATSDGAGLIVLNADGLGIPVGTVVAQLKQNLVDDGVGIAAAIPTVDRVIIVGSGEGVTILRTAYALADVVGWTLPIAVLVLFAAGVALARRRASAVAGSGVGLALGAGALGLAFSLGGTVVTTAAGRLDPTAMQVIYQALVGTMAQSAWVIALLGVFLVVLGWVMGRSRGATAARETVGALNRHARAAIAHRGIDTGAFGAWLGRHRVTVRTLVVIGAALWLFGARPLGIEDVILVTLTALVVAGVLEVLQRRPDEHRQFAAAASEVAS
ncbi:hypothetical protein [Microbacterium sp.]|uniref:hypothetical protein n=1 Tax=Microbacterium sp. TaxID=51671 RepID=UPI003A867D61